MAKENRTTTTPRFRASFAWVFKPQPPMEGSPEGAKPKYGVVMLFDKAAQATAEFAAMKAMAAAAARDKFGDKLVKDGDWFKVGGKPLNSPFRDGAEKANLEGYGEGVIFVSATSVNQPGCINADKSRIVKQEDFYSGCYARATVGCYGYDKAGNKGVAFGLNNLQKLGNGTAFSGRVDAEDDFEETNAEDVFDDAKEKAAFLD